MPSFAEKLIENGRFKPGQSGNPAGRPKGSRNKLAEDFLADAYQKWQQHGAQALETMAPSEPAAATGNSKDAVNSNALH